MPARRDLIRGLAAGFAALGHAQDALPDHTIYIPPRQAEKDRPLLLDFMDEYSFAMLITGQPSVQITNVPTVLDRTPEGWGRIWWHLAKANPQNAAMNGPVTVVFHGPHGYISPNWYAGGNAVPTWNFAVVHATGRPVRVNGDEELARGLKRLVAQNEARYGGGGKWRFDQLPDSYLQGMRANIVAYQMTIETVEGKFKLGHDRSEQDRAGMLQGMEHSRKERNLLELSRAYFQRKK